jgi:hypothetical protein
MANTYDVFGGADDRSVEAPSAVVADSSDPVDPATTALRRSRNRPVRCPCGSKHHTTPRRRARGFYR